MIVSFHADDELTLILSKLEFDNFDFAMNEFLKTSLLSFMKFLINSKKICLDNEILLFGEEYNEIN